ncbi:MAG: 50S ribosomal protein L13P [archaeon GW2011_AR20]|nr:MAG: 50S ribosomal protein L13P [archaeon GW2011_AR20]MBS3160766.1 50S ribosomal protein L13 [Candidatus Woesearchaeota archaeon]
MIINAENIILGRLASYAAKQALLGEKIIVINCEKAIISGNKEDILNEFSSKIKRGNPFKGPFYPRRSDMIVRRTIRGMLPKKKSRGREAYKNVMCYLGTPESLKNEKFVTLKFNIDKLTTLKYLQLKEISRIIGGKQNDL